MIGASRARDTLWASLGYFAIVGALLHRLLLGEVLSPSANLWYEVPFYSVLTEDVGPYLSGLQGDVFRYFETSHIYQYRAVKCGRFPLWNPHIFCGFPYHANGQSAMFSPFHWLYFVVDPKWAAGPVAALKLWLAGFGAFCLGRRLGMVPLGAFLAGAAWMLSAFNVRWLLWNLPSLSAWFPVVLLTLDRLIDRVSVRNLAVAGIAATVLHLSGHPETQFHLGVLAGLFVVGRVCFLRTRLSDKLGRILVCLAAQVFGLLGAAVALLPFLEQMHNSADWLESTRAFKRWLPLEGLLGAVAPDHFGRPRGGRFYQGPHNYIEAGLYVGLLPLVLALTACWKLLLEPRRTLASAAGHSIVIFSVLVALCGSVVLGLPGVFELLHHLPLFSKADNLRLILGIQFGAAMLCGAAWTQLTLAPTRIAVRSALITSCAIAGMLGVVLVMPGRHGLYSHIDGLWKLWTDPTVPARLEHRSLRTLVGFGFSVLGVFWIVLYWFWFRRQPGQTLPPASASIGLLLVALTDLLWVAYGFNPTVPPRLVFPDAPPSLQRISDDLKDGRMIATDEILAPNLAMAYGLRDVRGYDFPLDSRWHAVFKRLSWQLGITLLPRSQVFPCVAAALRSVCDKCCVRFLYTQWERKDGDPPTALPTCAVETGSHDSPPPWVLVQRGYGLVEDAVYQNPTAYPRVYFAQSVLRTTAEAAFEAVFTVAHDFRKQTFVEELPEALRAELGLEAHGTATLEYDGAEEVVIRAHSSQPGLLVLNDRYDANWRVEIDGRAARALRANYLFRGVVVPAGEHMVRWTYRPASFAWGAAISTTTVLALLVGLFRRQT